MPERSGTDGDKPESEVVLSCQGLGVMEKGRHLFRDVSFSLGLGQGGLVWADHHRVARALFQVCAGLGRPDSGSLRWFGGDAAAYGEEKRALALKGRIGLVHRETRLISNLTVLENMTLSLEYNLGLTIGQAEERIQPIMDCFDLFRDRRLRPEELSYEKLRMALYVRELVKHPPLFLFEMPLMDLGPKRHALLLEEIRGRADRRECAFLISAVPPEVGREWVDWTIIMEERSGRMETSEKRPDGPIG
ncbi:MAG: hypothetical protein KKB20_16025 [Proteobacteria bacterium]|nr:hypothetical protein [Pseudomonadota bacterium]